ncbi:MAG: hypothetical protein R2911_29865 [Caldilineaceae bacterium]
MHDARYLLQLGLEQLKRTRRTGLLALMDVARVVPANISTDDIGFQIGPRMNALGRLEDATIAVELLTTRDAVRAGQLAAKLERLNQQRRLLTSQITAAALEMINRTPQLLDYNALVLTHPAWHAGIVGIVPRGWWRNLAARRAAMLNPPGEGSAAAPAAFRVWTSARPLPAAPICSLATAGIRRGRAQPATGKISTPSAASWIGRSNCTGTADGPPGCPLTLSCGWMPSI